MTIPDRPRITVDVTEKQYLFFQQFPPSVRRHLIHGALNMMMDMSSRLGSKSLGLVLKESFKLEEYFGG